MTNMGISPRRRAERLAKEIKALRKVNDNMSAAALAALVGCSQSRIARLENVSVAKPDLNLVMDILDALDVDAVKREQLVNLARDAGRPGWWAAFRGMPEQQRAYGELEMSARTIQESASVFFPGLLQAPRYARTRFEDAEAYDKFDIDDAVRGREKRQEVLTRAEPAPVEYEAVLDEVLFRRPTAADDVMREQIDHLLRLSELANVTLRVLPFGAPLERWSVPLNPFSRYTFQDRDEPPIVAVETESSDMHLGDEEDMDRYNVVYERIRKAALSPDESRKFIKGARP